MAGMVEAAAGERDGQFVVERDGRCRPLRAGCLRRSWSAGFYYFSIRTPAFIVLSINI
jgi:hypothetical protein